MASTFRSQLLSLTLCGLLVLCALANGSGELQQDCQSPTTTSSRSAAFDDVEEMHDSLSLLQVAAREHAPRSSLGQDCIELESQQTYFTAIIKIGTPPQPVPVVADTGSTALVVESCSCKMKRHGCSPESKCIIASKEKSRTFKQDARWGKFAMYYGSGEVLVRNASDVVSLGGASAVMDGDLLLLTETRMMVTTPGILGLGIPNDNEGQGLLSKAGVRSYSICFNNDADSGVLRLNQKAKGLQLGQMGSQHWSLDFRGISVGHDLNTAASLGICLPQDMKPGQATPCAMVPDSGTTQILIPSDYFPNFLAKVCDEWPRCSKAARHGDDDAKAVKFDELLQNCESWLSDSQGIDEEMPSIHLHVKGKDGEEQTLTLEAWTFIHQAMVPEMRQLESFVEEEGSNVADGSNIADGSNVANSSFPHVTRQQSPPKQEPTGRKIKQCKASFGASDFSTSVDGPVMVVGLPLFYQYQVGFHLDTQPPSVTFTEGQCNSCKAPAVLSSSMNLAASKRARFMRTIDNDKQPRVPHFDTTRRI